MSETSQIVLADAQPLDGSEHLQVSQQGNLRRSTVAAIRSSLPLQKTGDYTLQASDNGAVIVLTKSSGIALTVPSGLGATFQCAIVQGGTGQVTVTGSGATVSNRQSQTKTAGQYAVLSLLAIAADVLVLAGDGA